MNLRHGHTGGRWPNKMSPTYQSWAWLKGKQAKQVMPAKWASFTQFLADMGERPANSTLRVDDDGNFYWRPRRGVHASEPPATADAVRGVGEPAWG